MFNDWERLVDALTKDIPASELEADIIMADVAGKLAGKRIRHGMTQREFAGELGISRRRLAKIERGECDLTVRELVRIRHVLTEQE